MAEKIIEHFLFWSRWVLAPFYIGLACSLLLLLASFISEISHLFANITSLRAQDAIMGCLSLIDLSLMGNLIIIVVFSGYENFVSKMDIDSTKDNLSWKGKVDFTGLKIKLISSIVAISAIDLLRVFIDVAEYDEAHVKWMVIIHVIFVISGLILALMDSLIARSKTKP